jgi:hypothetical protein
VRDDRGQITVAASALGAALSGSPVAAYAYNSKGGAEFAFYVALLVSLITIGAGVGKVYSLWKRAIINAAERDAKIAELCDRLAVIEDRQIQIQAEVKRQSNVLWDDSHYYDPPFHS